jgi:hypothetical protein
MNPCIRWTFLTSCVLFLSGTVQPAHADLITVIAGQYTQISPTTGATEATFTLTDGTIVSPGTLTGDPINNLLVDVKSYDPALGDNGVKLNDTSPTPQLIITNPLHPLTQMVIFDLVNPAALFDNNSSLGTGSISVGLTLAPTSPGIPFFNQSGFADADMTIDFTGIHVVSTADGRATWTGPITANFEIRPVPEPSALVLSVVGWMTLAGAGWVRRKRHEARQWPAPPKLSVFGRLP